MRKVARNWQDSRSTNQQSVIQRAHRAIGRAPAGNCRRAIPAELVCNEEPRAQQRRGAALMSETLANLSSETRQFPPPEQIAADANVKADAYEEAPAARLAYWAEQAERLSWAKKWDQVLDWSNPPFAKWFIGGELNVAYNCVDRHVEAGNGDKVAIHWEGEPGDSRTITYSDLLKSVSQAANTLTELGVTAGDRVAIYLPMIPEAAVAMLACARIGALHS